jgi:hypothetical protein
LKLAVMEEIGLFVEFCKNGMDRWEKVHAWHLELSIFLSQVLWICGAHCSLYRIRQKNVYTL